jgi:glutathione S-transferase
MDYVSIKAAQEGTALALVVNAGVPGPWSESAKALFRHHRVPFLAVPQIPAAANDALVAWTGHRNAPIAVYPGEAPITRALELLQLAERLGSGPSLLPQARSARIQVTGWIQEIAGEEGFGWCARHLIFDTWALQMTPEIRAANPMFSAYGYDKSRQESMLESAQLFLSDLAEALITSTTGYLIGDQLTAADIYWAYFSNLLAPLPDEVNPMQASSRGAYEIPGQLLAGYDPVLLAHRNFIFKMHLQQPLDF